MAPRMGRSTPESAVAHHERAGTRRGRHHANDMVTGTFAWWGLSPGVEQQRGERDGEGGESEDDPLRDGAELAMPYEALADASSGLRRRVNHDHDDRRGDEEVR